MSFDQLVAQSEAIVRAVPRVRYDAAARADTLGPGLDPVFLFVRDRVRFEAYPGVLRGAAGAYTARAANAWDRSLLLAEWLKRKGIRARFVMGRLPRPQAERLFARIFDEAAPLEADAVGAPGAGRSPETEAFEVRLRARALRDYAAIRAALGEALPSRASAPREEVLKEIEDHVWVQGEVNGGWVDLDSAFPDAAPGQRYGTAARAVEAIPGEVRQRVTVRVIAETLAAGGLQSETALEFSAAADALLDRQIFLAHVPGAGGGLGGAIAGGVMGRDAWTPVLWVDGETHAGKPIAFTEAQPATERGRPPGGGLGGLFRAGGALAAPAPLVAEWLEFELAFPDGRRDVTRRALVDRAEPAWRLAGTRDPAALAPLPRDANGLTTPRALHNIWFSAGRHNLADYAEGLALFPDWAGAMADPTRLEEPSFGELVWPLAMQAFSFLIRSDHLVVPALNDSRAHRFYADSPRILIVSVGSEPHVGSEGGQYLQYDLRRDQLRGVAREASAERGVVERKLWFGALEGALEHETGAEYAARTGAGVAAVASTSSLLTGEGAIGLRPRAPALAAGSAQSGTAARITAALTAGDILVVPRPALRGGTPGWWAINAQSADTRAVLGDDLNAVKIRRPPGSKGQLPAEWKPQGKVRKPIPKSQYNFAVKTPVDPCKKGGPEYAGVIKCVVIPVVKVIAPLVLAAGIVAYIWWDWTHATDHAGGADGRNR